MSTKFSRAFSAIALLLPGAIRVSWSTPGSGETSGVLVDTFALNFDAASLAAVRLTGCMRLVCYAARRVCLFV
jgi:hypothetical protein